MGMGAISVLHENLLIVCCYISLLGVFAWIVAGIPTTAYCAPVAGGRLARAAFTKPISEGADESMSIALRRSMLVLVWYGLRHHGRRQQRGDADRRYDHFQVRSHVREGILLPRSATLTATKPSTAGAVDTTNTTTEHTATGGNLTREDEAGGKRATSLQSSSAP